MKQLALAMISVAVLGISGCATILNDETHNVNLTTSNGKKTTVNIQGRNYTAPGIVQLNRSKEDLTIVADSDTCKGQTAVPSTVDSVFFLNILTGGVFGSSTDYATEEMWKYDTNIQVTCM